ncbi:hypothetical protein C1645_836519 [Glomus cerebriforme]|uniref:Uncharacterized protein n=1 Tax=Glomus cerebriforme TaxID=658196 RepID=A0A397S6W0_9GLOM|nr:hypothetical protein C1645_836519 [Glomus cerebriforme]
MTLKEVRNGKVLLGNSWQTERPCLETLGEYRKALGIVEMGSETESGRIKKPK